MGATPWRSGPSWPRKLRISALNDYRFIYVEGIRFEWDEAKNLSNRRKHGVSFEKASQVFRDPLNVSVQEPRPRAENCVSRLLVLSRTCSFLW